MQRTHQPSLMHVFALSLSTLLCLFSLQTQASKGGDAADNARVISLNASQLTAIKGSRISSYSLAAVSGGRMNPIPFQFDERTQSGYVFMKGLEKKLHKDDPIFGEEGFFDEQDELLFMLKDAGPRRKNGMAADGKVISEIEVMSYDNQRRYVYLIDGARLESENYYVRYSSQLGRVETDYYALKVDPKNAFMWQEFYYDSFDGAHPRQPIDTIMLIMKTRPLGGFPLTINNKHLVAKAIAEKSGPIRSTTQYKLTLTYLKTPLLNMKLQIVHHEHEIAYDAQLALPKVRRRLIANPNLIVGIDGYDLQGASVRVKNGPKQPAIVDGEISDIEKQIRESSIANNADSWLWMDTHYGYMLFSNIKVITSEEAPMAFYYEDDLNAQVKPEYHKGHLPSAGFEITKLPLKGVFRVIVELKMFNEELDIDVDNFADIVNKEPKVKVFNL